MRSGKRVWYENVLNIPEGTAGEFEIKHKTYDAGHVFRIASPRTAMLAGHNPKQITFDHPTLWHFLKEEGATWMSDLPIEQWQADETIKPMHGRVLVGGLGLGYVATALAAKPTVGQVTIVEKSPEVCELVWPHISYEQEKMKLVNTDLFEYLKTTDQKFHWAFYDIWASDGEATFHFTVVPLMQLSQGKVKKVRNWNEDVMRGQLFMSLRNRLEYGHLFDQFDPDVAAQPIEGEHSNVIWHNWAVPYWRWFNKAKPNKEHALQMAANYSWLYAGQDPELLEATLTLATFNQ